MLALWNYLRMRTCSLYADYPLYCLNPLSAMKLRELGFCRHTLSPEDDKANLEKLFSPNSDVIIYQDTPLFTSETCMWANMKGKCPGRDRCGFRRIIVENEYGDRFLALDEACKKGGGCGKALFFFSLLSNIFFFFCSNV